MKSMVLLVVAGIFSLTIGCGDKKKENAPEKDGSPKSSTLQIVSVSDSSVDCKISKKEIEKYYDQVDHNVCSQLEGYESTLQSIYQLASTGDIEFNFSGNTEEDFFQLIDAWKNFLIKKAGSDNELQISIDQVEPFSFQVVSHSIHLFTVSLENKSTGEYTEFKVHTSVKID